MKYGMVFYNERTVIPCHIISRSSCQKELRVIMEVSFPVLKVNIVTDVMKNNISPIKAFEFSPLILAYQNSKTTIETICFIRFILFVCRISQ